CMNKKVVVIGTFDSKGIEYRFLIETLKKKGCSVITINTGVLQYESLFPVDVQPDEIARAGGVELSELRKEQDRGHAVAVMSAGAEKIVDELFRREKFDGIIGMGGTAGTNITSSAMRGLPFGLPKICLSTVAAGDVSPYVGISDILMFPSLTDISGINSLTVISISNAAGALVGMMDAGRRKGGDLPVVAISMFGNTTTCVTLCREQLERLGFEV